MLTICNSVCLQKRKMALRGSLGKRYHYLIKPSNQVTEDLLGPILEQKIADSQKIMSATRRLSFQESNSHNLNSSKNFRHYNNTSNFRKYTPLNQYNKTNFRHFDNDKMRGSPRGHFCRGGDQSRSNSSNKFSNRRGRHQ